MTRQFGRIESPIDERDYKLSSFIKKDYTSGIITEKRWRFYGSPLDQGETGHCVGFSMANFGVNDPINTKYTNEDAHKFYYLCKIKDGEPKAETGSNIRSAAKVLVDLGVIQGYAFAETLDEVRYWLLNKGCMIVGTHWYEGMDSVGKNNIISLSGKKLGGHAYLLNEVKIINGVEYFGIQNSWNGYWGDNGRAYISSKEFEKLLKSWGGEALAAVEIEHNAYVPKADSKAKFNLMNFISTIFEMIFGKK
jgi:hypothetical protein